MINTTILAKRTSGVGIAKTHRRRGQAHDARKQIAEFVSGLQYDAIPEEVRHRLKLLMLDSLGCALYGADLEWSRMLQNTLTAVDATRQCSVWGTKVKLSAPL